MRSRRRACCCGGGAHPSETASRLGLIATPSRQNPIRGDYSGDYKSRPGGGDVSRHLSALRGATTRRMSWSALPDDLVSHLLHLAPAQSLPPLVRLEQRTRSSPAATARLQHLRVLVKPPFSQPSRSILGCARDTSSCCAEDFGQVETATFVLDDCSLRGFAQALASGAMEQLQELKLMSSNLRDPGFIALAAALGKGALPQLEALCVSFNAISDAGVLALFDAASTPGALQRLTRLSLNHNPFGEAGLRAVVTALGSPTVLPSLQSLVMPISLRTDAQLRLACSVRRISV